MESESDLLRPIRKRQLGRIGPLPANLALVPVDFETDRLDEALIGTGFDPEVPAFFAWLGVTCYLTREAVRSTIGQISAVAAPGQCSTTGTPAPGESIPRHAAFSRTPYPSSDTQ